LFEIVNPLRNISICGKLNRALASSGHFALSSSPAVPVPHWSSGRDLPLSAVVLQRRIAFAIGYENIFVPDIQLCLYRAEGAGLLENMTQSKIDYRGAS